jgi:cell division protein FtsQ
MLGTKKYSIVFMGKTPNDLTEIVDIVGASLVDKVDYITMVESRRWNIYLKNGIVIYLPEKNPLNAINTIMDLDKRYKILSRDIKVIDLRNNQKILVKTKK